LGLIILYFIASFQINTQELSLINIRTMYYESAENSEMAQVFFDLLKDRTDLKKEYLGYKGMSYLLMAKHAWTPYYKYKYFQTGKKLLETVIDQYPDNAELKFLRYCIQSNIPVLLNYKDQMKEDLDFLKLEWKGLPDMDLKKKIKDYLLVSDELNESDKLYFK
jgi:hypothetical protein